VNDVAKGALLAGAASLEATVHAVHLAADQLPPFTQEQNEVLQVVRDLVSIQQWLRAAAEGTQHAATTAP
jgi:uncharacterized protein (DUF2235 family)